MTLLEEREKEARLRVKEAASAEEGAFRRQNDARREYLEAGPKAKDQAKTVWDDAWDAWFDTLDLEAEALFRESQLF